MKKNIKIIALILVVISLFSCSSTENCTKTIVIPERTIYSPSGSFYTPASSLLVPCDYVSTPIQEQVPLQNFTYEILNFNFNPNTGNNTNRLKFDIKLNNLNNFAINGFAYITVNVDGTVSSSGFLNGATSSCSQISPNSNCIFSYDKESSLIQGTIQSIQITDVKYFLAN